MKVLNDAILSENMLCPKCGWKGCGHETKQLDLFLTDAVELYCKDCEYYFGFISVGE